MVGHWVTLPWVVHAEDVAVEAVGSQALVEVAGVDGRLDFLDAKEFPCVFCLGVFLHLFHELVKELSGPILAALLDGVDLLEVPSDESLHLVLLHHRSCVFR